MIKFIGESREWSDDIPLSTIGECLDFLETLDFISCDSETEGFDPHTCGLLLLQVGNKETQYVIDCKVVDITPLKNVLETKKILFHNAKFDFRFLYHKGIDVKNIYDTFLGEIILHTGYNTSDKTKPFYIDSSLKAVVKKYCNYDLDKTIRGKIHKGLTKEVIIYAAEDVEFLEDVMNKQLIEIEKWDLERVVKLENEVTRVFALMEYNGISFDKVKINEVIDELEIINKDLINKLDDIVISESNTKLLLKKYLSIQLDMFQDTRETIINWSSPAQKTEILNMLGIKVDGVADKVLQENKKKHSIIPLFIEYSKYAKLRSSFGSKLLTFINPITNRVHANTWQILQTARISQSDPNLLQIPSHSTLGRKIKSCFIASEGYKLVSSDLSGAELRLIAEYSGDPLWVKTFIDDDDLHSILCCETFGIPIEDVKKPFPPKPDISYRFLQKTINFGKLIYHYKIY
jgi:DNA polymerase-1